jgi:O-acetylserine/cysteine efflux transporter
MAVGMPPGLASIVCQLQVFLTIGFAAAALGERPTQRQLAGSAVAVLGLVLVGSTVGSAGFTVAGLLLTLASATSWAVGNVLLRSVGKVDMLSLISWLSLVPPLPLLALSLAIEGPAAVASALTHPTWLGVASLIYIAVFATIFGYGTWGHLLKLYPTATVAPFALLVPVFGMLAAALMVGERFGPIRFAGAGLILIGLALVVLPARLWRSS